MNLLEFIVIKTKMIDFLFLRLCASSRLGLINKLWTLYIVEREKSKRSSDISAVSFLYLPACDVWWRKKWKYDLTLFDNSRENQCVSSRFPLAWILDANSLNNSFSFLSKNRLDYAEIEKCLSSSSSIHSLSFSWAKKRKKTVEMMQSNICKGSCV